MKVAIKASVRGKVVFGDPQREAQLMILTVLFHRQMAGSLQPFHAPSAIDSSIMPLSKIPILTCMRHLSAHPRGEESAIHQRGDCSNIQGLCYTSTYREFMLEYRARRDLSRASLPARHKWNLT